MRKPTYSGISFAIAIFLMTPFFKIEASTSIIVGKKASKDGSVLLGHNQDCIGKCIVNAWCIPGEDHETESKVQLMSGKEIPQIKKTWGYIWFQFYGEKFSNCMINEMGVTITSNPCLSREDNPSLTDGGISLMLEKLLAERATSAREAVQIGGSLLDQFGYNDSGKTLILCDQNEAWILSIVFGKHWIAQRVPDDELVVVANNYVIRNVNFHDSTNFIFSKNDILQYAITRGWYDPSKERSFDFNKVYAKQSGYFTPAIERKLNMRQWRGYQLLAKKPFDEKMARQDGLPFSMKAKGKIDIVEVIRVLRDHYENTQYELANDFRLVLNKPSNEHHIASTLPKELKLNPNNTTERTICSIATQFSYCAQLRNWLPINLGSLLWVCYGRPDCNLYIPWYIGITKIPDGYNMMSDIQNPVDAMKININTHSNLFSYNPTTAFWIFNELENIVDLNYNQSFPIVQTHWEPFEEKIFSFQKDFEISALQFNEQNPNETKIFLTKFTKKITEEVLLETKLLIRKLKTQLYH